MNDKPDFLYEVGARTHGVVILLFFAVVWVAAIALGVALRGLPGGEVFCWCWSAAATLTVAFVAGKVVPFMVRGGTYRVVVQDDWLRVESPHEALGPSFAVALPDITELVVQMSNDSLDSYKVHTR